jgi:hypothetical protein
MYPGRVIRTAAQEIRSVLHGHSPIHERLRDRLAAIALVTIGLDLVFALLAYLFEHGQPQTELKSYGSALFWTSTQLLTVSSQIPNPFSTPGRILDVIMEIYAITIVGSVAGSMGAFFVGRGRQLEAEAEHEATKTAGQVKSAG